MNLTKTKIGILSLFIIVTLTKCDKSIDENEGKSHRSGVVSTSLKSLSAPTGLTSDFQNWLNSNGYSTFDFMRNDITTGSFGGRILSTDVISRQPVVFIHGNSDKALGTMFGQSGWTASRDYFLSNGYTNAELYGFTWGDANAMASANQDHSYKTLSHIRAFIEAVKSYTGATKVDVVTHSMGVTLARKAILGGTGDDSVVGVYDLGDPISDCVDTFVGIAGANRGLVSCYQCAGSVATCSNSNGLYPGYLMWGMGPFGVSDILQNINSTSGYEGDKVYTIWSTVDEVIGYGCVVYGSYTTRIPGQDGEKVFRSVPYGHFNVKDKTCSVQYNMVVNHVPVAL